MRFPPKGSARISRLALAAAFATLVVAFSAAPATAGHMAWRHGNGEANYVAIPFYQVNVSYGYRYNGHTVQQTWITCRVPWSVVWSVEITWCGTWNNNLQWGGDWMEPGANFRSSFLVRGIPMALDHWLRKSVSRFGQQCCQRGG